jgi:hypothetical protein
MATVPSWQLRQSFEAPSGCGWVVSMFTIPGGLPLLVSPPVVLTVYDAVDSVWFQRGALRRLESVIAWWGVWQNMHMRVSEVALMLEEFEVEDRLCGLAQ